MGAKLSVLLESTLSPMRVRPETTNGGFTRSAWRSGPGAGGRAEAAVLRELRGDSSWAQPLQVRFRAGVRGSTLAGSGGPRDASAGLDPLPRC